MNHKRYEAIMVLVILAFITLGLWLIGIVWAFSEANDRVDRIYQPTPAGSVQIDGELPVQQTVDGKDLQGTSPCLQGTC